MYLSHLQFHSSVTSKKIQPLDAAASLSQAIPWSFFAKYQLPPAPSLQMLGQFLYLSSLTKTLDMPDSSELSASI